MRPTTWWQSRKRKNTSAPPASSSAQSIKAYADAFGAKGFAVTSAETLESTLRAAMDVQGPAVVAVPVDYSDNALLMGQLEMGRIF